MSGGFNLNIYNYGKHELENLLSLPKSYSNDDVTASCANLRDKLFQDSSKSTQDKGSIHSFLEQVKHRLIKDYMPNSSILPQPSFYSGITNRNQLMVPPDASVLAPTSYIKKDFLPTFPIKNPPENLNPLSKRIIRRTINIDTRFRDNYYATESTDLHINLPTTIKNAITMKLVGLEFPPCSIFAINKRYGNHYFHIGIGDDSCPPPNHKIIIPDGNYTGIEMVQRLNNEFAKLSIDGEAGIDEASCRIFFKIGSTGNASLYFNRRCDDPNADIDPTTPLQMKLGYMLGFTLGTYHNGQNPQENLEFIGEAPYDGTGFKYLYLVVDDYNNNVNNYFVGAFNNSILSPNILARIPQYSRNNLDNALLSNDVNDLATSERNYFGPINIQKLKIQLIDPFGRIVSLNNRDYSLALEFDCIYN